VSSESVAGQFVWPLATSGTVHLTGAQLELTLEDLEAAAAALSPTREPPVREKSVRRPLPAELPRQSVVHDPLPPGCACPACGGALKLLGEDASEMLEYIPSSFKVIRHVRPKLACLRCDKIAQAAAPSRGGWPVRVSWHTCWYRSSQITYRYIDKARSLPGQGLIWIGPRWPIGSVALTSCLPHWSRRSQTMYCLKRPMLLAPSATRSRVGERLWSVCTPRAAISE
jgi:transposase